MLLTRRAVTAVAALILFFSCVVLMRSDLNPLYLISLAMLSRSDSNKTPLTTHIVMLQFKENASRVAIKEVASKMLALKKSCRHPSTGWPYIKSIHGGRDVSAETLQNGMNHAFILQFESNEDRDYYVEHDPAHQAFKDATAAIVEKTRVVDFQEGVFS